MSAMTRRWLVVPLLTLLVALPASAVGEESDNAPLVTIGDVRVRLSDHGPVVLLSAEGKTVPIFVDHTVAASIQGALTGEKLPRPLSHDLMHTILEALGGRVLGLPDSGRGLHVHEDRVGERRRHARICIKKIQHP